MFSMYSTNDLQHVLEGYFGEVPWNDMEAHRRAFRHDVHQAGQDAGSDYHGAADTRVLIGQTQERYLA
jgi:hypothetical protein